MIVSIFTLTITLLILVIGCKSLPKDNANVTTLKFQNLMGTQYTEILLVFGDAVTSKLTAGVYNTIGLNDPNKTGNTSTDAAVAKINLTTVQKENNALKTILNGPRVWTVDWVEVNSGTIRNFEGLQARWVMWFQVPKGFKGGAPYQLMQGKRDTHMGINAGSGACILDDPQGTSWVMKSMDRVHHPD